MKQECPTAVENTAVEQFRDAVRGAGFSIEGLPDHLSAAQALSLAQSLSDRAGEIVEAVR